MISHRFLGDTAPDTEARLRRWAPILLAALGVLAWSNAFSCAFILDDKTMILGNPRLHRLWPPWLAISVPTRWVADLSFALNHALSGFNPADYHLTNLAIHLTGAWLLFGLVRRTLLLPVFEKRFAGHAALLGLATAALWLVHPLQTESVTYVVQRIEALMGLAYLAVFYTFTRSLQSPHPGRWRLAAWVLCLVGMGTKEIMTTAPVLLLAFDASDGAGSWRAVWTERRGFHAAMWLTLLAFGGLLAMGIVRAQSDGGLFYGDSLRWRYLLTQAQVILHYLRLTFVPWPLCLDYRWPLVDSWRQVVWQAPLVAGVVVSAMAGVIRCRPWAFPVLAVFVILAPTSSVMPLPDAAFEHRMYLPLAALLALAVVAAAHAIAPRPIPAARAAIVLAAVLAGGFAGLTWLRNKDYRDEDTMWRDVIAKRPDNYRAYISLSTSLLNDHRPAEALDVTKALLSRMPDYRAMPAGDVERRWRAHPELPFADYAMGHNNLGAAYLAMDRNAEALAHFQEAVRVMPHAHWAHSNVAKALYFAGHTNEALAAWAMALEINPKDGQTRTFLAIALAAQGRMAEALGHFRQVLALNPDDAFVRAQVAWMLATDPDPALRDGPQAVLLAESLVRNSEGQSARAMDILAAACAETGRWEDAVRFAEQAIALGRQNSTAAPGAVAARDMEDRLRLYRDHRPYHQDGKGGPESKTPAPFEAQGSHSQE